MVENLGIAFQLFATMDNVIMLFIGVVVGCTVGAIPGMPGMAPTVHPTTTPINSIITLSIVANNWNAMPRFSTMPELPYSKMPRGIGICATLRKK